MYLKCNRIHRGDAQELLDRIEENSIPLSFWSPPYHVGKDYEKHITYENWLDLLGTVIRKHFRIIQPGGFLVVNIGDILVFRDDTMPKIQALNPGLRKYKITREDVLKVKEEHPDWNRYKIAEHLGCSEQTVDRRLNGNNIRGGKHSTQTRVKLVGGLIEKFGSDAGFYLYDRRVWVKDPAWANSQWHNSSYRSVDESEHLYIFWKPGVTTIDRTKLSKDEWGNWGSRGVWQIPSVRANDNHEAKFPLELARRVVRLYSQPGDIVLDCFMGSGTTAVAAIREKRRYMGIELQKEYVELAKEACVGEIYRQGPLSEDDTTPHPKQQHLL